MTLAGYCNPAAQPYNIILTGSFGVGKSSLFHRLSGEVHSDFHCESLRGATSSKAKFDQWTHAAKVNGETVKVTLWDTGSMERSGVGNITRSYFRKAVGIILVYDSGNRDSLDALQDWVFYIKDAAPWQQQHIMTFTVWANTTDHKSTAVSEEQLNSFLTFLGLSEEHCFVVNAYTGFNVLESYQTLIDRVHHQLHTPQDNTSNSALLDDSPNTTSSSCSC